MYGQCSVGKFIPGYDHLRCCLSPSDLLMTSMPAVRSWQSHTLRALLLPLRELEGSRLRHWAHAAACEGHACGGAQPQNGVNWAPANTLFCCFARFLDLHGEQWHHCLWRSPAM